MTTVAVLNTDSGLSGKTLNLLESDQTITGLKTYSRGAQSPFAVAVGSTKVVNLDADTVDGIEGAAFLKADGTVALTAGLSFPATQVASSGVNVLDDYEEGTFSPTLTGTGGSGQTYTTQTGTYIKIGRLVIATMLVTLAGKGTVTGPVSFGALPFTIENVSNGACPVYFASLTSNAITIVGTPTANTTTVLLFFRAAAGTSMTGLDWADLSATSQLITTVAFRATS